MHRILPWVVLGFATVMPGCTLMKNFANNIAFDPLHYDRYCDIFFRKVAYSKMADEAWCQAQDLAPQMYSRHYYRGFKEAYVDYLIGGEGNTPLVPPRRYWFVFYQSPEGMEAISDWFAGWRHGHAMAKESGYRQLAIIPSPFVEVGLRGNLISNVDPKTGEPNVINPTPIPRSAEPPPETLPRPREQGPASTPSNPTSPTPQPPADVKPSDAKPNDTKSSDVKSTSPAPLPPIDLPKKPTELPVPEPKKPVDAPPKPPAAGDEEFRSLVLPGQR